MSHCRNEIFAGMSAFLSVMLLQTDVWAQSPGQSGAGSNNNEAFFKALVSANTLGYLGAGLVGGWLFSVAVSALLVRSGFPPTTARVGCSIGIMAFCLYALFFVFGVLVPVHAPIWLTATLLVAVVILAVCLYFTRRHPTAAS